MTLALPIDSLGAGSTVGPYTILREIGRGSYSRVFEARDERRGGVRALKVFLPPSIGDGFVREAGVGFELRHPNLLAAHDMGYLDARRRYVAFDLALGGNLRARLGRRVPERFARHVLVQIARALDVLHAAQIVHRDLKPENVLLASDEPLPRVLLGDYGAAERVRTSDALGDAGSPAYMAPEQIRGSCDTRADVYALGVLAFELLAGVRPFVGDPRTVLEAHQHTAPNAALLPHRAAPSVLRALEKSPDARFQTPGSFVRTLEHDLADAESPGVSPPEALAYDAASGWSAVRTPGRVCLLGDGAPSVHVDAGDEAAASVCAAAPSVLAVRDRRWLSFGGRTCAPDPLFGLPCVAAIRRLAGDVATTGGSAGRQVRVYGDDARERRRIALPFPLEALEAVSTDRGERLLGMEITGRHAVVIDVESGTATPVPLPSEGALVRGAHGPLVSLLGGTTARVDCARAELVLGGES